MVGAACISGVPALGLPKISSWGRREREPGGLGLGTMVDAGEDLDALGLEDRLQAVEGVGHRIGTGADLHARVGGLGREGGSEQQECGDQLFHGGSPVRVDEWAGARW